VSLLRLAQGCTKVWNNGLTHGHATNQNPPWVAPYLVLKAGNSLGTGGGTPATVAESAAGADSAASKSLHRGTLNRPSLPSKITLNTPK
jgi:hypothetical protein